MAQEWYTVVEASDFLRIHRQSVYRMIYSGHLPATKLASEWRINRADLDALFEAAERANE